MIVSPAGKLNTTTSFRFTSVKAGNRLYANCTLFNIRGSCFGKWHRIMYKWKRERCLRNTRSITHLVHKEEIINEQCFSILPVGIVQFKNKRADNVAANNGKYTLHQSILLRRVYDSVLIHLPIPFFFV